MGATDVFPFIPYQDMTFEECVSVARGLASRVAEELGIPIYLYGKAANTDGREHLPDIRRGGYEVLDTKLRDPAFTPDFGESVFHPTAGATVIGARDFLLAYNVNLDTQDASIAKQIARAVRESGKIKRDKNGKPIKDETGNFLRVPGSLAACQGDGWFIAQYGLAQVTMNLLDIEKTGLHTAFEAVKKEAEALGVGLRGSELIGLCPKRALIAAGEHFLSIKKGEETDETKIFEAAVQGLGLNALQPFDPRSRTLEYTLAARLEVSGVFSLKSVH
jgi:glutamate formiminotransferase/formiminotetrahydrofolate cyclodeaminase